jgi:hypothetical protein
VSEPTGSQSSPGSTIWLPQTGPAIVVVVVVVGGASVVVVVGASVVVVGAAVVLVVVVASGHWQPSSQATNAPFGEFGSGQVSEPTGSHSSPGPTVPSPQKGAAVVVVVVVVIVVVVGAIVVVVVVVVVVVLVVVVVVVGGGQSPGSQVPGPMFVPPASVQSAGLRSWQTFSGPGCSPVQQRIVPGAQPPSMQASQHWGKEPTHALPPLGALHLLGSFLMEHRVLPFRVVRQQVTEPTRPHVDLPVQLRASRAQSAGRLPSWTSSSITSREHFT